MLLTIQGALVEPGVSGAIPPWVYATVNGAVIAGALTAKVLAELMAAPVIVRWLKVHWPQLLESVDEPATGNNGTAIT